MFEEERERSRMDVYFGGNHKDRLESNALLADIVLRISPRFRAKRNLADGFDVRNIETVFVVFDNNFVRIDTELYIWIYAGRCGTFIVVVLSVLNQFKDESSFTLVKICREAHKMLVGRKTVNWGRRDHIRSC